MVRTRACQTRPFAPFSRTVKAAFGSAVNRSTGSMASASSVSRPFRHLRHSPNERWRFVVRRIGRAVSMAMGRITRFKIEAPAVIAIHPERQGTLWIPWSRHTSLRGRPFPLPRDGQFEKVAPESMTMPEDQGRGRLLTGGGKLRYLNGHKTVLYGEQQGLPHTSVIAISQDSSGTLWAVQPAARLASFSGWQIQDNHDQGRASQQ